MPIEELLEGNGNLRRGVFLVRRSRLVSRWGPSRCSVLVSAPRSHLGMEHGKRERVRCSSLFDWPVYPRLRRIMQGSERARNARPAGGDGRPAWSGAEHDPPAS